MVLKLYYFAMVAITSQMSSQLVSKNNQLSESHKTVFSQDSILSIIIRYELRMTTSGSRFCAEKSCLEDADKLYLCITDDYQGVLPRVLKAVWLLTGVLVDGVHSNYCTRALKVKLKISMLDMCQDLGGCT